MEQRQREFGFSKTHCAYCQAGWLQPEPSPPALVCPAGGLEHPPSPGASRSPSGTGDTASSGGSSLAGTGSRAWHSPGRAGPVLPGARRARRVVIHWGWLCPRGRAELRVPSTSELPKFPAGCKSWGITAPPAWRKAPSHERKVCHVGHPYRELTVGRALPGEGSPRVNPILLEPVGRMVV